MAARIRLTDPRRAALGRRAVEDNIPYPGTVNQPDRKFKTRSQYDIDWETINHPYPDMRHEWQNDSRDDIGFGIPEANGPTVASIKVASTQAVRVAVLLLGEKVSDEVIEAQARDLVALGPDVLGRAISRFAESQKLYVADDDADEDDKAEEGKEASAALADKMSAVPPTIVEPATASDDEDKDDKAEAEPVEASTVKADDDEDEDDEADAKEAAIRVKMDEIRAERAAAAAAAQEAAIIAEATRRVEAESKPVKAEDEATKDDDKAEEPVEASTVKADDDKVEEPVEASTVKADDDADEDDKGGDSDPVEASGDIQLSGPNEMDIELTSASSMDMGEGVADPRLAELFDDPSIPREGAEAVKPTARGTRAAKAGIKELGGQPRAMTASQGGAADISSIWDSAPDVSEVFR